MPAPLSEQSIRWAGAIAVLLVISSLAFAQESSTGNVSGTVTGPRGASVSGADITLTTRITGQATKTTTSPAGTYALRDLASGGICSARGGQGLSVCRSFVENPGGIDCHRRRQTPARGGCRPVLVNTETPEVRGAVDLQPDGAGSQRSWRPRFDPARARSSATRWPGLAPSKSGLTATSIVGRNGRTTAHASGRPGRHRRNRGRYHDEPAGGRHSGSAGQPIAASAFFRTGLSRHW